MKKSVMIRTSEGKIEIRLPLIMMKDKVGTQVQGYNKCDEKLWFAHILLLLTPSLLQCCCVDVVVVLVIVVGEKEELGLYSRSSAS